MSFSLVPLGKSLSTITATRTALSAESLALAVKEARAKSVARGCFPRIDGFRSAGRHRDARRCFNDTAWCGSASSSASPSHAGLFVIVLARDVVLAVRRTCRVRLSRLFSACRIHAEARGPPDAVPERKRDGVRRRRDAGSARDGDGRGGPKDLRDAPYLLASEGQSMGTSPPLLTPSRLIRRSRCTHTIAEAHARTPSHARVRQ